MYNFIDVNEVSEAVVLPSEALKINGEFIENLIPGYRTLSVEGREAMSQELSTYETGIRDGSKLKNRKYPARELTIKYQIKAASNEDFRDAYNKLGGILNVQEAELIFNDELDKFYIGTPESVEPVEPGRNSVTGEFTILCADPFKYSVLEYEAEANLDESSVLIDYNGTHKAFPILEADFFEENELGADGVVTLSGSGDCGYVAFFNESEKIIQLGNPDEVDGTNSIPKSQTLVNSNFNTSALWGSAAKTIWKENQGTVSSSAVAQNGTLGAGFSWEQLLTPAASDTTTGQLLTITSKANKPEITYKLSAKTSDRQASSVKVTVSITTSLPRDSSYFGRGYGLKGHFYTGKEWKTVTIKDTTAHWKGKSGHTVSISFTVSGLSAATKQLSGFKFKVTRIDSSGTAGTLAETACKALNIAESQTVEPSAWYLKADNYGIGSGWHGTTATRVIPPDASGEIGAPNCTLSFSNKLSIGKGTLAVTETGAFQVMLVSGSGSAKKIVAGCSIYKTVGGKKANIRFYVNNKVMQTLQVDVSYANKLFNASKTQTISKAGSSVTFNIGGIKRTYKDAEIEWDFVTEVTVAFLKWGMQTPLSFNGLHTIKFVKNNCNTWLDIPNKFSANDVVEADCKNGEIYLNGVPTPALGALGNDWEDFYLTPGLNQIGFAYSDWVQAGFEPKIKVRYREVFL